MHPSTIGSVDLSPRISRAAARTNLAILFTHIGLASADLDARVLVCAACGIDHAGLIREPDAPLGAAADGLTRLAVRRMKREPVSRILGRREFWGLSFAVTPDVLDPRPDTEGLVGSVLDAIGGRSALPLRVLDLGTGSGAILAALLHELPACWGVGVDRSIAACRVASANLRDLGLAQRAFVVQGNWTDPLQAGFDIIVSNPPYVRRSEIADLESDVRDHDPMSALDGGIDGLDAYRAFLPHINEHLTESGVLALECGSGQGAEVAGLAEEAGLAGVAVYRDLSGHDRVVLASHGVL